MADVPHDMLCFALSGWWILYSMTAACLLCPYEVFMSLLIAASISSTVTSLAWSWPGHPNPPLCQSWPQIAGATNSGGHKTQHSAPSLSEGTLTLYTESVPTLNTLRGSGQFWHYEEVIMNHFRISCFVHKLIIMSKNRKLYIFFTIWPKTHFGQEQERIVVTLPIEINTGLPYLPISSRHLNISWNIKYPSVPQMTQEGTIRPGNDYEPLAGEIDEAASNNQNNRPG